ncbi:MAG: GIY-YIG nuclease family protein [Selenomonadaceae bacterium]|nr:GIY-YIG nuclease family protein [Selenomonadaceae bacterium]
MICIYMITNTITGDFYIGQTIDFDRRKREHMRNPQPGMRDDVEKYGWSNFTFLVLEKCPAEKLTERENFFISALNPVYNTVSKGYERPESVCKKISESLMGHEVSQETREKIGIANFGKEVPLVVREKISRALIGTTNGTTSLLGKKHTLESRMKMAKPVICVETDNIFWSVKIAAECCNISVANIESVLHGRQITAGGVHWRYADESLNGSIRTEDTRKKPIICKQTGKIFDSAEQAATVLKLNSCGILQVLHGRAKTCGGYSFEYFKKVSKTKESGKKRFWGGKPVSIICVETKKVYPMVKTAANELGIPPQSISAVLNGRRMSTGGLHFKYLDETLNVPEKKPSSAEKPVIVLETKQIYPSVKATANALNAKSSAVSAVLRGKGLTICGFHVMYLKDYKE